MEKYQEPKEHSIEKIFARAREKNIPLKNEPEMMKVLIKLGPKEDIPPEIHKVTTEILSFVCRVFKSAH